MLQIGIYIDLEFLTIAMQTIIMLSSWLAQIHNTGQSKTLGVHNGVNKVLLDLKKEILVEFALDHHSQFDYDRLKSI
jgi:hypothetical protein